MPWDGWTTIYTPFRIPDLRQGTLAEIGIPDDEYETGQQTLPGWEISIEDYLNYAFPVAVYEYDFGDGWIHVVQLEARLAARKGRLYPNCLVGERKCPLEDCGGIGGYENFLEAIADPCHPEHKALLEWVGGSLDAEDFNPLAVKFDNPQERWERAFD